MLHDISTRPAVCRWAAAAAVCSFFSSVCVFLTFVFEPRCVSDIPSRLFVNFSFDSLLFLYVPDSGPRECKNIMIYTCYTAYCLLFVVLLVLPLAAAACYVLLTIYVLTSCTAFLLLLLYVCILYLNGLRLLLDCRYSCLLSLQLHV